MASTGETEGDLEAILRVQLLRNRITAKVRLVIPDQGQRNARELRERLPGTLEAIHNLRKQYVMEDCSQPKK